MQLFELVSPRLFRPLAGPNRAFYAELLLLLWEECRHTADYSISRAEAVSRAEDYFAALAKPLALDADGAGDEDEQPTRDPHTLAVGFLLRLRRTGWLEEQPGSYESEPTFAFMPEVTPLLDALEEILNPRVVTYTGKLYKAWQLLGSIGQEKSPYENVLREVAADLETLNKSLRALNASIGHYIDRLTHNRTPQEVLELFDQYEEKVVAAAYHRFKTSDNLFNYRAYLEEELDDCEQNQLPRLALDYARVEHCAPGEAAPRVRALIQQQRDALEAEARQLGIWEHVHFLGYRHDVPELCRCSDIFAFMSFREGMPVALMEAMSCGLPAVCSKIRGNTDLIDDGVDGLFAENTPEGVAAAIMRLYHDPALREQLGRAASQTVSRFDAKAVQQKVKEIYLSL